MARTMTVTELKGRLLALLDDVAAGEEIEITRHGRVIARLEPARGAPALEGRFRGVAASAAAEELLFATDAAWDLP